MLLKNEISGSFKFPKLCPELTLLSLDRYLMILKISAIQLSRESLSVLSLPFQVDNMAKELSITEMVINKSGDCEGLWFNKARHFRGPWKGLRSDSRILPRI